MAAGILALCPAAFGAASPPGVSAAAWGQEAAGDTKTACIYTRNDLTRLAAFQRRIGRAYSCVVVFNDAAPDWAGWETPWVQVHPEPKYQWDEWVAAKPGRRLVLTQSLVPPTRRTTGAPAGREAGTTATPVPLRGT